MEQVDLEKALRKLEIGKFWDRTETDFPTTYLLDLSQRFTQHFSHSGDARFLNTALKINDTLKARLGDGNSELLAAEKAAEAGFQALRRKLGL